MTQDNVSIEVTEEASGTTGGQSPLLKIDENKMKAWVDGQVKNAVVAALNDGCSVKALFLCHPNTNAKCWN